VSTPPDPQPDDEFVFPVGASPQQQPKKRPREEEDNNPLHDIADEVIDSVTDRVTLGGCGCAWRLVTLPFRLVVWVIGEVFD
jgi:hypothetical protein